jgi:hypothetical protein
MGSGRPLGELLASIDRRVGLLEKREGRSLGFRSNLAETGLASLR